MKKKIFVYLAVMLTLALTLPAASELRLDQATASRFAQLTLRCVQREYPNKLDHVMNNSGDVREPRVLHPAFYGCFDWHSSVHGHWLLVRLLHLFPDLPEAARIRQALNQNLSAVNLQMEAAYFEQPSSKSFERTYGWAWFLKLAEELNGWQDQDGQRWAENLKPLAMKIVNAYQQFLPKQTYAIRTGVHPNSAFALACAWDYARKLHNLELENLVRQRSLDYFLNDRHCPAGWEPGGEDFFSPCLLEADLMRRLLAPEQFATWFSAFLPLTADSPALRLLEPATVSDRSDPKLVHLDGLNLSRVWCLAGIAANLASKDPLRQMLRDGAEKLARAALAHVSSGSYEGEHWLGTFAVYALAQLTNSPD